MEWDGKTVIQAFANCAFVLFTRVPIAGLVKTRLLSCMTAIDAARLQMAMVLDVASCLSEAGGKMVLCHSDEWRKVEEGRRILDDFISQVKGVCSSTFVAVEQKGCGIGSRMAHAVRSALSLGVSRCVLVGSDIPIALTDDIREACLLLNTSDVVFGPCEDGGFWLVGVKEVFSELFEVMGYGTSNALLEEIVACQAKGKSYALGSRLFDVDDAAGFEKLLADAQRDDSSIGERTRQIVLEIVRERRETK